jgi:hypothetical protein
MAVSTFESDPDIFKKHFAKNILADLLEEKCITVKLQLARLCDKVEVGYSKSLDKVRDKLAEENDSTII